MVVPTLTHCVTSDDTWSVIDAYFDQENLVRQQTELYDTFLEHDLQEIVRTKGCVSHKTDTREYQVNLGDIYITKPQHRENNGELVDMYPHEARIRNLTYACNVYVDVTSVERDLVNNEETVNTSRELLVCMPMMVKSRFCHLYDMKDEDLVRHKECPYDLGGYFIVNGTEKVVIAQERMASNVVFVFNKGDTYSSEIHSVSEGNATKTMSIKYNKKGIFVSLPFLKNDVPLMVVFFALGLGDRHQLEGMFEGECVPEELDTVFDESHGVQTQGEALHFLYKNANVQHADARADLIMRMLLKDILPHCGTDALVKASHVGYMVKRLFQVVHGKRPADDRDHYNKKRVDFTGSLLASLFKALFMRMINEMSRHMADTKKKFNAHEHVKQRHKYIFLGLKYSLATGNWGEQKKTFNHTRQGVSQVLNRYNFAATLSHLRRINTPMGREGKLVKPRLLHSSQWGIACPAETPEGQACGLIKNLAFLAAVSDKSGTSFIIEIMRDFGVCMGDTSAIGGKVFVNGTWIGTHPCVTKLTRRLVDFRRNGTFHPYVSISHDIEFDELFICTDYGRICRPVLVVDRCHLVLTQEHVGALQNGSLKWRQLLEMGIIEYIDAEEQESLRIAQYPSEVYADRSFTHCEIHPAMMLGVCASNIPFPDHNQAPRNTYQSAMSKQSIGTYLTSYLQRMDTISNVLYYPQKPLVSTKSSKYLHTDELPTGINAIVAIACYGGYNQEDSLIMNQSAIDRGLFRSLCYHSETIIEKKTGESKETIEKPSNVRVQSLRVREGAYDRLDVDGIAPIGTVLKGDDILVCKTISEPVDKDMSMRVKNVDNGVVDEVLITKNEDHHTTVKVRVRTNRIPQMGDKFASRHGQKGTVGITYRQEDMPFTSDGMVPDLIINPHAIPSRMTIGHLIECVLGKVCTLAGEFGDATPFSETVTVDGITTALQGHGFDGDGSQVMYNGMTGERLEAKIFIGPTYYQRLKHMVDDKIHSRSHGPMQVLTRQPVEGRSRDGGLRFGEMERGTLLFIFTFSGVHVSLTNITLYRLYHCARCVCLSTRSTI